ncbi:MAG: YdeI/OmpD-associated family protein [Bacteroidota bacterium]
MRAKKALVPIAPDLADALEKNKKAKAIFEKYPPSHKRAWIEYIDEAKKPGTRAARIQKAIRDILEAGLNYR